MFKCRCLHSKWRYLYLNSDTSITILVSLYIFKIHNWATTTNPTKWVCAQRRLRSAWAFAQSCGQRRLWSDWADAQVDLSFRWTYTHFVGFVMSRLIYLFKIHTYIHEFHCQRNFIFLSQFSRLTIIWKILWLITIYIPCLSFCIIISGFNVRMRGYSHSSAKVPFPCCTCTCWYFIFKTLYTIKLLEDRPVSVCKVKCLNLQRNARLTFGTRSSDVLRDRHHCTKRSTPLQLSPICFTLQKQDGQIEENV